MDVRVEDNDRVGIDVTRVSGLTVREPSLAEVPSPQLLGQIKLMSRPSANVEVTLQGPNGAASFQPYTVTFIPSGWNTAQNVYITAQWTPTAAVETEQLTFASTSADANYNNADLANYTEDIAIVDLQGNIQAGVSMSNTNNL